MRTIIYNGMPQKDPRSIRKLRIKLPNYLIKRKISMIREKIIARKYGTIYLRKVYGKYYPSECRRYYEKKLLRKYFEKVKAHWFEEKEVYRLLHKANIFFEKKLTRKMFNGWQFYATKAKIIKQQARILKHNYDEFRMKNVLCIWKMTTNCRKEYKLIRSNAIELYHLMYSLLLLLKLTQYYSEEMEENLIEIKSIICGRFFILRKYTRKWKIYIFQQRNNRILRSKAVNYRKTKISVNYFSHWQRYVCYKHTKREIVQLCRGLYEDRLLKMILQLWKNKTTWKIVERKNMLLASKFCDDLVKRKLIKTWRRYVKHKLQGRSLKHKAIFFYTMRSKQKVLNALSRHVNCCKNTKLATQKLKLFYRRLLTMTVWNEWTKMIAEKNDSELRDKLLLAISFYRRNITGKYLTSWIRYNTTQQRKKSLKLKAIDLSKRFYCKKYLKIWKIEYRKKRRVVMLEEKAFQFFNDSLMRNAISKWIKSYNYAISIKAMYEKSVLHHERKLTTKCFASWISFCNQKIRTHNLAEEAKEYYLEMLKRHFFNKLSMNVVRMKIKKGKKQVAENLYEKNLVIKAFADWRKYCIRVKELKNKVEKFEERIRIKLKRKIIIQWKLYVRHKKCSHRKTLISITHRRKKAYRIIFERLKNYVIYKKEKNLRLAYLKYGVKGIEKNLIKIYFQNWRVARLNTLKEKRKIFRADEFHKSHLKNKYLLMWRTFLIQHKIKRQHQSDLNNVMNYFILKKCLGVWYAKYQALLNDHVNENWASKIYEIKIRYKYFIAWKYFSEIEMREKKEINNAKEFHKKLVIKEGLQHLIKIFLSNTESRYENQLRNVERNSSYEFELLKKYFNTWHKAVSNKTRIKAIKDQTANPKKVVPTSLKINNRKYVSNLIPRFIIPEFMKNEIKLRFGIGQYSNQIPITVNEKEILRRNRISKVDDSFSDQKSNKNVFHSRIDDNSREKIQLNLKSKSEYYEKITNNDKIRNKQSYTLSPDSLKSDSDSAKTYTVQNPTNSQNLNRINPLRSDVSGNKHNKENDYKLLPPAAFYISLN